MNYKTIVAAKVILERHAKGSCARRIFYFCARLITPFPEDRNLGAGASLHDAAQGEKGHFNGRSDNIRAPRP